MIVIMINEYNDYDNSNNNNYYFMLCICQFNLCKFCAYFRSEIIVMVTRGKVSVKSAFTVHILAVLAANSESIRIKIKVTRLPFRYRRNDYSQFWGGGEACPRAGVIILTGKKRSGQ